MRTSRCLSAAAMIAACVVGFGSLAEAQLFRGGPLGGGGLGAPLGGGGLGAPLGGGGLGVPSMPSVSAPVAPSIDPPVLSPNAPGTALAAVQQKRVAPNRAAPVRRPAVGRPGVSRGVGARGIAAPNRVPRPGIGAARPGLVRGAQPGAVPRLGTTAPRLGNAVQRPGIGARTTGTPPRAGNALGNRNVAGRTPAQGPGRQIGNRPSQVGPNARGANGGRGPLANGPNGRNLASRSALPRGPNALRGGAAPRSNFQPTRFASTRAGSLWRSTMAQRFRVAPPRSPGPPPGQGIGRTRHEMTFSGVPPRGETRFVSREVVVQVAATVPRAQVEAVARQLGVTPVASLNFGTGRVIYHFRAAGDRPIPDLVRQFEQNQIVAAAEPNYVFRLDQAASEAMPASAPEGGRPAADTPAGETPPAEEPAPAADATLPPGDATQYSIGMLHLHAAHKQARGRGVTIAVIDSEIDVRHPDLRRAVKEHFDPSGRRSPPDLHGTGMAGAIGSRYRLLGVAPDASIIAIKAFDNQSGGAEATSFQILQGLDHAIRRGAKVINMSFAGPYDPMIERKLQEAYDQGIVLVAAAGNAGPKSPPLYPAADPNVIAVTAVDAANKPFARANQGNYIQVAAPGVDVLVPAPNGDYQLTTGTSVAAAHVSGVVALMLEKRPELKPDDVRAIIAGSAKPVPAAKPEQTGAGLVDPVEALTYDVPETAPPPMVSSVPLPRPRTVGSAASPNTFGAASR